MSSEPLGRVRVAAALLWDGPRLLVTRRPPGTHLAGLWEFPGGKQEPGETIPECLRREIREELGVEVIVAREWMGVEHVYPDRAVELHFLECWLATPRQVFKTALEVSWMRPAEMDPRRFPPADAALLAFLRAVAPDGPAG